MRIYNYYNVEAISLSSKGLPTMECFHMSNQRHCDDLVLGVAVSLNLTRFRVLRFRVIGDQIGPRVEEELMLILELMCILPTSAWLG